MALAPRDDDAAARSVPAPNAAARTPPPESATHNCGCPPSPLSIGGDASGATAAAAIRLAAS